MTGRDALFHLRLLDASNAVSSGDFHPGEVKNLLREAAAKLVGYEAFQEAGTNHAEGGDPIWEYYDAKLWRDILFWKSQSERHRKALSALHAAVWNWGPRWSPDPFPVDHPTMVAARDLLLAPVDHETDGVGSGASRATEAGVTPGEASRVATDASSGRGEKNA